MNEQSNSDNASSQFPIIIIAVLLGLFVIQDLAFKPTRPVMSDMEKTNNEGVRSRLWQDPFGTFLLRH